MLTHNLEPVGMHVPPGLKNGVPFFVGWMMELIVYIRRFLLTQLRTQVQASFTMRSDKAHGRKQDE
jgi:hypothetical protein